MEFFKGLYNFEIVLLILGTLLFLLLVVALGYLIFKNREYNKILTFFIFPVIMIGFPGIQKISYENGKVELSRGTKDVEANPDNQKARQELTNQVEEIESRASADPAGLVKIASANMALGDTVKARQNINKAQAISPNIPVPKDLLRKIRP